MFTFSPIYSKLKDIVDLSQLHHIWHILSCYLFSDVAEMYILERIKKYSKKEQKFVNYLKDNGNYDADGLLQKDLDQMNKMIEERIDTMWIKRGDIIDVFNEEHYNDGYLIWDGTKAIGLESNVIASSDYVFPPIKFPINEMGRNDFWNSCLSNTRDMQVYFDDINYIVQDVVHIDPKKGKQYVWIYQHKKIKDDIWCMVSRKYLSERSVVSWISFDLNEGDENVFNYHKLNSYLFQQLPLKLRPLRILLDSHLIN